MSNKEDRGNEQNGFFWILGLLKYFNGFENLHADWIGYLNMICGEKKLNWVIFELGGFLKVWKITNGNPMILLFFFKINASNWNMPMLKGNTTLFGGKNKFWGNFWAEEYHMY